MVIPTNEEQVIARHTLACLHTVPGGPPGAQQLTVS
jgi:hypothetical protein